MFLGDPDGMGLFIGLTVSIHMSVDCDVILVSRS